MGDFSTGPWRCVYNIPICGGFCAPTDNPDASCYRHVSNEYTVPLSPFLWKARACMETNLVCTCFGRTGFEWGDRKRTCIMSVVMTMNLFLIIFYIIAAMGMTSNADLLKKVYWSYGEAYTASTGATTKTYLGVNMRHDEINCGATAIENKSECMEFSSALGFELAYGMVMTRSIEWGEPGACNPNVYSRTSLNTELGHAIEDDNQAAQTAYQECQSKRYPERALIVGVMMQVPTAATNCQRSTRFGDVNCQKMFGLVSNCFGLLTSVASMRLWYTSCFQNMPEEVSTAKVTRSLGAGFMLLAIAIFCKLFDLLAHCIVPAPDRSHLRGSSVDTLAGYMHLANTAVVRSNSTHASGTPVEAPPGEAKP